MFAKRRANARNLCFCIFINFVRRARKVLFNPALRKHFSVMGKLEKRHSGMKQTREPPKLLWINNKIDYGDQRPLKKTG